MTDFDAAKMTLEELRETLRKPTPAEKRKKDALRFPKESDLCAAFIASLDDDWQAYPESCGFDILLVRKEDGFQIGIEAKLTMNAKVVCQAAEGIRSAYLMSPGPDCRAILVPEGVASDLGGVCDLIGITVIRQYKELAYVVKEKKNSWHSTFFNPPLPELSDSRWRNESWHQFAPAERLQVPDYVPDVASGVKCPVRLTHWKIGAIKLVITLQLRGYLTRRDFKHHDISMSRWTQGCWLESRGDGRWTKGQYMPDFRGQHPVNYVEIEKDYETWKVPDTLLQGVGGDTRRNKAEDLQDAGVK